jgi:hypothetical protein
MDKATLPLSEEVLAAAFNISSEEFSTLFEEKDGVKTPKDQQAIRTKLLSKLGERIDSLVSEKTQQFEKQRKDLESKHRRLAFKEIEDKAKEMFGVEMRWSEDGFQKIVDNLKKGDSKPVDVERSEPFQNMVKSYEEKIKELSSAHSEELSNIKSDTVKRTLRNDLFSFFKSKEKELALPPNDHILKRQIDLMIENDLLKDDMRVDYVEGKPMIVDSEGKPAIDKANGYAPFDYNSYVLNVAKQGYFPELKSPQLSSPNPGSSSDSPFTIGQGDNKKSYSIPQFKSFEELSQFTQKVQIDNSIDPVDRASIVKEANKQLETIQE